MEEGGVVSVIGPRGSGKSAVVERAVQLIAEEVFLLLFLSFDFPSFDFLFLTYLRLCFVTSLYWFLKGVYDIVSATANGLFGESVGQTILSLCEQLQVSPFSFLCSILNIIFYCKKYNI